MDVYATNISKGIVHGIYENKPVAVIRIRGWMGYQFSHELDKDSWKAIGEVMKWSYPANENQHGGFGPTIILHDKRSSCSCKQNGECGCKK